MQNNQPSQRFEVCCILDYASKVSDLLVLGDELTAPYLFLAAVDLPFLLSWEGKHGLPVLLAEVEFILATHREQTGKVNQMNVRERER